MMMHFDLIRLRIVGTLVFLIVPNLLSHYCCYAYQPCPTVADTTIAQMAAQWVTSFTKPYCLSLDDRRNILLNHKMKPGVFYPSSVASMVFTAQDHSENFTQYSQKALRHVIVDKAPVAEIAIAKLRVLRSGTALATYAAGKKAFSLSRRVEAALEGFAPTSFDFASTQQIKKDTARLAHLRGLIQAQELKLVSMAKMLASLKEGR
jgi:hypothetical protein